MTKSKADMCGYKGCGESAIYILELDNKRMAICERHFRLIIKQLQERAKRNGAAKLYFDNLLKECF
ncbi:MAG: hypothetical protein QW612_05835 [Candidatus Bathyarchaeia archaeon]